MADFTGQNIKDTYQSLLQVSSNGQITNGTGSILPIRFRKGEVIEDYMSQPDIVINHNITALGNISSSGTVTAAGIRLPSSGIISFDDSLDGSDQYIIGVDNNITIDGDDVIKLRADIDVRFQDNTGTVFAAINPNAGHITSSGIIKASGSMREAVYIGGVGSHITASGNISSSGTVTALSLNIGTIDGGTFGF